MSFQACIDKPKAKTSKTPEDFKPNWKINVF
jgi:hypothetical protein